MPNPTGVNQMGGFPETVPYGDKARQGMLQRLAPLAGDASGPLNAPRRAKKAASSPQPSEPAPVPVIAGGPPQIPSDQLYASIASIAGASPLVQELFGAA